MHVLHIPNMCIFMYVCIHVYMCKYVYVCGYMILCMCMHACLMCIYMFIHVCMFTYMYGRHKPAGIEGTRRSSLSTCHFTVQHGDF